MKFRNKFNFRNKPYKSTRSGNRVGLRRAIGIMQAEMIAMQTLSKISMIRQSSADKITKTMALADAIISGQQAMVNAYSNLTARPSENTHHTHPALSSEQ